MSKFQYFTFLKWEKEKFKNGKCRVFSRKQEHPCDFSEKEQKNVRKDKKGHNI